MVLDVMRTTYWVTAVLVEVTSAAADEWAVSLLVVAPLLTGGLVHAVGVDRVRGRAGVLRAHGTEDGGGGNEESGVQHVYGGGGVVGSGWLMDI